MPSFDYRTNPIIYYPDSITVDTHECTIEDIPENERPVKWMKKCFRLVANGQKCTDDATQYIDFGEVTIFRDKDVSIDFWFNTTSDNYSRIIDFTLAKEQQGITFSSNGGVGKSYPTLGEGTWSFRRGSWNHFCWQYHHYSQENLVFLNGLMIKDNYINIQDTIFPYTYLGKSVYPHDDMIDCRYAGIRFQYGLCFDLTSARNLKYSNTTMTNLKTT